MKHQRIAFVVAVARNGVIGRKGGLPWRISSDLKRFKQITMGKPVIMGRKTWESLPRRPLPGRLNIVITRHRDYKAEDAVVAASIDQAIACAREARTPANDLSLPRPGVDVAGNRISGRCAQRRPGPRPGLDSALPCGFPSIVCVATFPRVACATDRWPSTRRRI